MPAERVETLVIGGGQAGLAMSHHLKQRGLAASRARARPHRRALAQRTLGRLEIPVSELVGAAAGFSVSARRSRRLRRSRRDRRLHRRLCRLCRAADPLRRRGDAAVARRRDGFIAETSDGAIAADNVVVATGPYQRAHAAGSAARRAGPVPGPCQPLRQSRATSRTARCSWSAPARRARRSPKSCTRAGRRVFLSVGQTTRLPRRYRGHDLIWWFEQLGMFDRRPEERGPFASIPRSQAPMAATPSTIRRFAAEGITLLGRVAAARDRVLDIAPGLGKSLAEADLYYATFLDMADEHARNRGLDLPEDPAARAQIAGPALRDRTDPPARSARRGHQRGDLGDRLWRRFRLDRYSRLRRRRRAACSAAASPSFPGSISSACNG